MPVRASSFTITYLAFNAAANAPQANDASHHTLKLNRDGIESTPTNAPTDGSSGECNLVLTAAEADADMIAVYGTSATPNVLVIPARVATQRPAIARPVTIGQRQVTITGGGQTRSVTITSGG